MYVISILSASSANILGFVLKEQVQLATTRKYNKSYYTERLRSQNICSIL